MLLKVGMEIYISTWERGLMPTMPTEDVKATWPKGVAAVYDAGPEHLDRFTVFYSEPKAWGIDSKEYLPYVSMCRNPTNPGGLSQHGVGKMGDHNGKEIKFTDLPELCRKLVYRDLTASIMQKK